MAMPSDIAETVEIYKAKITNNPNFSNEYKTSVIKALNIASLATNGISVEEKIQKMTEAIYYLGVSQVTQMIDVNELFYKLTNKHCEQCQAMRHAKKIDEDEKNEKLIEDWKRAHGILNDNIEVVEKTWTQVTKELLLKPLPWITVMIMIISPYGIDIIKMLLDYFAK